MPADYNVLANSQVNAFQTALAGRQQFNQNRRLQMEQQMLEAEQQRIAQEEARKQKENQLLAGLLGPETADMVTMNTPAVSFQVPREQLRAEQFNQLAKLNPQTAIQFQNMQAQRAEAQRAREVEEAKRLFTTSEYVARSAAPKTLLLNGFPDYVRKLEEEEGVDFESMTDDDVRKFAQMGMAHYGSIAGIGPSAPENETTDDITEYEYARRQGYKGSLNDYVLEQRRAGSVNVNVGDKLPGAPPGFGYVDDPASPFGKKLVPIPGAPKKDPTEGDKKNRVLVTGMLDAERQLGTIKGGDSGDLQGSIAGQFPIVGGYFQPTDVKKYNAAAKRWAANYLYVKSGATAGEKEVAETVKQFFPQPGEDADIVSQKNAARANELANMQETYAPDTKTREFATEEEAEAAGLKPGTRVIIGGVSGTWQ